MNCVVPDASVLLKWVLPDAIEAHTEKALAIRDQAVHGDLHLIVPSLWKFEVGNTVTRLLPKEAIRIMTLFGDFHFDEYVCTSRWLKQVVQLCHEYQVTFYDAAYHAVALCERGLFVTADRKYYNKTHNAGRIMLLEDWKM